MTNPLLERYDLPPFSRIEAAHVEPAIRSLIARNKERVNALLDSTPNYSWDNLLAPLEEMDDELARAWSPVAHLNSVRNSEALRAAYNGCLPLLSEYNTWMGQHEGLYRAYSQIRDSVEFAELSTAQRKTIDNALRDFRLAGIALPPAGKARYGELRSRLSELSSRFSDNVLDATNAWSRQVSAEQLDGLPENALAGARQTAAREGVDGYVINLEFPSYQAVMTYCHDRSLREEVYAAYCTRASDQGPDAGRWDNSALMEEILSLRLELARLVGFDNYAQYSLATKMADSTSRVIEFLGELAMKSRAQGLAEWAELETFARESGGPAQLAAWDVGYYAERLRQQRYSLSQEEIRPYLPVDRVLSGLFEIVRRLYGVETTQRQDFDCYDESVRLYELSREGEPIALFYVDLYARPHKRGGAWMGDCRIRRIGAGGLQLPVTYLVCNFTPPVGDAPALLSHQELTTLFHEFGHGLHHMLTGQTIAAVSGINGVPWDAVELPSQFMENWCWEAEALALISGHHRTGETLPETLLQRLLEARNFQAAMGILRQLEFALFDFRLHLSWAKEDFSGIQALLDEVRAEVAVVHPPPWNRFQHGFTHIFAGGYAAGYYSYKWAEVLSADAFSRFEEEGIFNPQTGSDFLHTILEQGGSREPMELFVEFRGREPSIEPLLRHSGIERAAV